MGKFYWGEVERKNVCLRPCFCCFCCCCMLVRVGQDGGGGVGGLEPQTDEDIAKKST